MTGRSRKILSRLPAHFEATRPGKQFESVVDALGTELEVDSAILAAIRRSHRLADADELRDVLLIGARHGVSRAELAIVFMRWARALSLLDDFRRAASVAERARLAEKLCGLWGIRTPAPRLPLYAPAPPQGGTPDLNAAKTRLLERAGRALATAALTNAVRARIAAICAIHARGNGTVRAVLEGAANALDLDMGEIRHTADRFWHAVAVRDRQQLARPVLQPATGAQPAREIDQALEPAAELMGLEENPLERAATDQVGRHHAELFSVIRRGFETALPQVRVTGKETKTVGPMVVNRDEGHGVGYALAVPSAQTLTFTEEGRALVDNTDMTSFAYAWRGGCFAGPAAHPADFVFDGPGANPARRARFAQATPAGALDPAFVFPHSGESLPMPGIAVGETRLAFFVQQASFSSAAGTPPRLLLVAPRPAVGFLDNSVFAPGESETVPAAALVSLSWLEHRAFCVRVLIPRRFRALTDDQEGTETRQRVAQALQRFRPAGVEVRVDFVDDRWLLGHGILVSGESDDPAVQLGGGTVLWAAPAGA